MATPAVPQSRLPWYRRRDARQTVLLYGCYALFTVWVLAPLYFTFVSSFTTLGAMTQKPPQWIPQQITFDNYVSVFTSATDKSGQYTSEQGGRMVGALFNSLLVGILVAFSNLVIGGLAGYSYSRYRFRGSRMTYFLLLASRVVPGIAIVVPFFALFRSLGLINTPWALLVAYNLFTLPLTVWLLKSYFDHLPQEVEEAAFVDGASRLRTLVLIVVPLARPGLVATGLLVFLEAWSEFFYAVVLTNNLTVPPLLASYVSLQTFTWSSLAAATVVSLIPPIVLAVVFQRYIISGLSTGAVK